MIPFNLIACICLTEHTEQLDDTTEEADVTPRSCDDMSDVSADIPGETHNTRL
jgi:hypothetical protein